MARLTLFVTKAARSVVELHIAPADRGRKAARDLKFQSTLNLPGKVGRNAEAADVTLGPKRNGLTKTELSACSDNRIDPAFGIRNSQVIGDTQSLADKWKARIAVIKYLEIATHVVIADAGEEGERSAFAVVKSITDEPFDKGGFDLDVGTIEKHTRKSDESESFRY